MFVLLKIIYITLLLFISVPANANEFLPINNNDSSVSFTPAIYVDNKLSSVRNFSRNQNLSMNYSIQVDPNDVGLSSNIYLVVNFNGLLFMKTQSGAWQFMQNDFSLLEPAENRLLTEFETVNVMDLLNLPAGEYQVAVGYQDGAGKIKYHANHFGFIVFEDTDLADSYLHRVINAEVFLDYINNANNSGYYTLRTLDGGAVPDVAFAFESTSSSSKVSTTNIQESGVDEADKIKTDGDLLFTLQPCSSGNSECLIISQMTSDPAGTALLSETVVTDSFYQGNLYLHESRDAQKAVWLSSGLNYSTWAVWDVPYYWQDIQTEIAFVDVSDPTNTSIENSIVINGTVVSSRKIGDTLYLVTRFTPLYYDYYRPYLLDFVANETPLPETGNKTALELEDILPTIQIGENPKQSLVNATDCYIPVQEGGRYYDATLTTLVAIPLESPESFQSVCIAGQLETLYMSQQSLYLATSRYNYTLNGTQISYDSYPEYSTDIHKFSLLNGKPDYRGSGNIQGHLGWESDKRAFRFGENNGILKVATSSGQSWNNTSTTRVSVLKEDESAERLVEISSLENLGKPGERLYSARFVGDRGFLVTYKVTDPLYVLDFSDPEKPAILGELEINGYSDYLHPLGERYLLGLGKDAIPDEDTDRGAWYQGVKLSLFDVTPGQEPAEIDSIVLGKRGTSSNALYDHHALSFLSNEDNTASTLAIPVQLHDTLNVTPSALPDPSLFYNWSHSGLYVFNIEHGEVAGISLEGVLFKQNASQYIDNNERSVIQDRTVHYIYETTIASSKITDLASPK